MALTSKISEAIFGGHEHAFLSDGKKTVLINTVLTINLDDTSNITKHAIEKGSDVTDHIVTDPQLITVSGILSDEDFSLTDPTGFGNETIADRKKILDDWKITKPILTYHGHEYDIENVEIQSLSWGKNESTGSGVNFNVTLTVVNIAETQTTTALKNDVTQKGNTAKASDKKPGSATAANNSWAKNILTKVSG